MTPYKSCYTNYQKKFAVCNLDLKYTYNVQFKNGWALPLSAEYIYNTAFDKSYINFVANFAFQKMTQRNAIIMAAGTSSRFVPLSVERPKGLVEVKGEILIERQIRQLKEAGITDITLVVGYKAEMFAYLRDKYAVDIVYNEDFARYNNTSSLIRVIEKLGNTFICSSDNYFPENVFTRESVDSYYSALYAEGKTNEYCLITNTEDQITDVKVGGHDSWYMVGHVFLTMSFLRNFENS